MQTAALPVERSRGVSEAQSCPSKSGYFEGCFLTIRGVARRTEGSTSQTVFCIAGMVGCRGKAPVWGQRRVGGNCVVTLSFPGDHNTLVYSYMDFASVVARLPSGEEEMVQEGSSELSVGVESDHSGLGCAL